MRVGVPPRQELAGPEGQKGARAHGVLKAWAPEGPGAASAQHQEQGSQAPTRHGRKLPELSPRAGPTALVRPGLPPCSPGIVCKPRFLSTGRVWGGPGPGSQSNRLWVSRPHPPQQAAGWAA